MKIKDLISGLQAHDPDATVLIETYGQAGVLNLDGVEAPVEARGYYRCSTADHRDVNVPLEPVVLLKSFGAANFTFLTPEEAKRAVPEVTVPRHALEFAVRVMREGFVTEEETERFVEAIEAALAEDAQ